MSQKLTAEEIIYKFPRTKSLCDSTRHAIKIAMYEYASYEVKDVQDKLDKAMDVIRMCNHILNESEYSIDPHSPAADIIFNFLHNINDNP